MSSGAIGRSGAASVDRHGTPGGPLVIALHGAAINRKAWLPLARALPAHFELWAPDLPGHGSRSDERFTLEASLELVEALVALARPRRVVIAGDSLGGYIALEAGLRIPHGVCGIVAGGCSWPMTGLGGVLARITDLPVRAFERIAGERRTMHLFAIAIAKMTSPSDARAIVDAGLRMAARSESLEELRGVDPIATVRNIRVPIGIVNGARDWPTRAGESAMLTAARSAERTIVPKMGHGVGFFAPAAFAAAIATIVGRTFNPDARSHIDE